MKRKIILIMLAAVVSLFMLSGCLIQTDNNSGKTAIEMNGSGDIDSLPDTINATVGSTFGIKLEANPTTGFTWQVYISDEELVKLASSEYEPDKPQTEGSGGITTLTFEALKKGETTVKLEYAQDWEGGETGKTKEITVIIE